MHNCGGGPKHEVLGFGYWSNPGPVKEYLVKGGEYQVIDIPPGLTHSITNVGSSEMVTLFWSSELFDPDHPDTYYLPVDFEEQSKPLALENA